MKIICSVVVNNRTLPSLNMPNKKAVRSSLIIGTSPSKEVLLFHQTNNNVNGKKYKVKDNIANIFVKFVNEGKATIRFKEPEHDLAINCDPIQLKGFLKTLKLSLEGVPLQQLSNIQNNATQKKKPLPAVKTKLAVLSKEEYPVLEGFPRTLQHLTINNANQKLLDSRVLRLRSLVTLNLENNSLTTLPEQLGTYLPSLAELHLRNNLLGPTKDWRWIVNNKLQKQLKLLDLRSNEIECLPDKVVMLENLVTLNVNENSLQCLPHAIGCMKSLRFLHASENSISYLPSSIVLLKLFFIDISKNNFFESFKKLSYSDFQVLRSLKDIAASCVISNKIGYSNGTIPLTLMDHLQSASFCFCGEPCFSDHPQSYIRYNNNINNRATTIVSSHNSTHAVAVRFCSFLCYTRHVKAATPEMLNILF